MSANQYSQRFLAEIDWTQNEEKKLDALNAFVANIPSTGVWYEYKDLPAEEKLDFPRLMADYWTDLLNRVHYASVISLLRANAWFDGVFSGVREGNFHAFGGCLRGLIESVADSGHSLLWLPDYLTHKHQIISRALGYQADLQSHEDFLDEKLETEMIHFSHARGLRKGQTVPNAKKHKAKTIRDYLDTLKEGPGAVLIPVYEYLCEISHPSSDSALPFTLIREDREDLSVYEVRNDLSFACVVGFSMRHKDIFRVILNCAVDPPVACLKTLDTFSRYRAPSGVSFASSSNADLH